VRAIWDAFSASALVLKTTSDRPFVWSAATAQ
jgi:hypothetical protein